jgi:hypothetical protein
LTLAKTHRARKTPSFSPLSKQGTAILAESLVANLKFWLEKVRKTKGNCLLPGFVHCFDTAW